MIGTVFAGRTDLGTEEVLGPMYRQRELSFKKPHNCQTRIVCCSEEGVDDAAYL